MGILIGATNFAFSSGHIHFSAIASADSQRLVSLYADGQKRLFSTDAPTVGEVVNRAGLKLHEGDLVEPSADTPMPANGPYNINIYRARPVLVTDGLKSYRIRSAYQSPRLLAQAAGLTVYPEDRYDMRLVTDIVTAGTVGEQVSVQRSVPLTVKVDGKVRAIRTQASTIGSALAAADISLGLKDTVSTPVSQAVVPGESINITRVSEVVATLTQTLSRPTKTITDPTLLKGTTQVKDPGTDGQKTVTYRIHYQDGVETGRDLLQVVSQTDPAPKVVVVGTKVLFAGSVEYWRPLVEAAAAQYGLDPNMMMRIMSCESGGNATTVSRFIVNGEHPTGLFQFLPSTWRSAGGTNDNILDGAVQIKLAAKKMAAEGTSAWQCR
ncbi:MAG TPA: ubiquitin-like domain-containing protein [Candidatus Saccharimonadia bacterium]